MKLGLVFLLAAGPALAMSPGAVVPRVAAPAPVAAPPRVEAPDPVEAPARVAAPERVAPPDPVEAPARVVYREVAPQASRAFSPTIYRPAAGLSHAAPREYVPDQPAPELEVAAASAATVAEPAPAAPAAPAAALDIADLPPDAALEALIRTHVEAWPGLTATVHVVDLDGKRRAEVDSGLELYPGTLARLPIVAAALEELGLRHLPATALMSWSTPDAKGKPARRGGTLPDMIRAAARADAGAANAVLDLVTPGVVTHAIAAHGLVGTRITRGFNRPSALEPNRLPASDVARLLWHLGRGDLPSSVSAALREDLAQAPGESTLGAVAARDPSALVAGTVASARMQDGTDTLHAAALVTSATGRYVVVVMTQYEGDARPWVTQLLLALDASVKASRTNQAD